MELNKIYFEDCLETMKRIPDGSIDLMLTDPPYNVTACKWDYAIDLPVLWKEWLRIVKENGAFVFTASQPFTTDLINSNRKNFKYECQWIKNKSAGGLSSKYMPLKINENILIFGEGKITYNPIRIKKSASEFKSSYRKNDAKNSGNNIRNSKGYKMIRPPKEEQMYYYPTNILYFNKEDNRDGSQHPSQKPVELFRYLIKTYSNEGDTVFDGYSGSGTTAEACIEEKRNFIVSENNKEYFDLSEKRIKNYLMQQKLF